MRQIRYHQIADDLRHRIASGHFRPGQVLPSEAALGAEHDASRVTIRKALEVVRAEGLVESRQGFGWSVAGRPLVQPLADLVTIERQLAVSGRSSARQILDFRFVDAPARAAGHLGPRVLEVRRLNLADGVPLARVTVWCREDLAAPLSKAAVEQSSFLELVNERPVRATQTMQARIVGGADAGLLGLPTGAAVLEVYRVTFGRDDKAILVSEHVFPGHLTELVADLPWNEAHEAAPPPGLRLVDGTDEAQG